MAEERLHIGDVVQHFKRETVDTGCKPMMYMYVISDIATHTETGEKLVIYKALYHDDDLGVDYDTFARPYDMFMEEVDHDKYPDIKQKYRFEKFIR